MTTRTSAPLCKAGREDGRVETWGMSVPYTFKRRTIFSQVTELYYRLPRSHSGERSLVNR